MFRGRVGQVGQVRKRRSGHSGVTVRLKPDTTYDITPASDITSTYDITPFDTTTSDPVAFDTTTSDPAAFDTTAPNPAAFDPIAASYVVSGFSRTVSSGVTQFVSGSLRPCLAAVAALVLSGAATLAQSPTFHVGRTPTDEDARALGIMVAPDGKGLPAGSGTAVEGKEVFTARCASCHGAKGEGGDGPALVGGKGTLATPTPKRTVGSYWPYATTVWDYVNRAMPFNQPGTLRPDEVYAVSAYVLFLNDIVAEKQVLDAKSLPLVKMPNRDGFISDPRPDVPGQPLR